MGTLVREIRVLIIVVPITIPILWQIILSVIAFPSPFSFIVILTFQEVFVYVLAFHLTIKLIDFVLGQLFFNWLVFHLAFSLWCILFCNSIIYVLVSIYFPCPLYILLDDFVLDGISRLVSVDFAAFP